MVKAVFDTRPGSGYQDSVGFYEFPKRYVPQASQAVGDWLVYYQPKRGGGRSAYIGVARLLENPATHGTCDPADGPATASADATGSTLDMAARQIARLRASVASAPIRRSIVTNASGSGCPSASR